MAPPPTDGSCSCCPVSAVVTSPAAHGGDHTLSITVPAHIFFAARLIGGGTLTVVEGWRSKLWGPGPQPADRACRKVQFAPQHAARTRCQLTAPLLLIWRPGQIRPELRVDNELHSSAIHGGDEQRNDLHVRDRGLGGFTGCVRARPGSRQMTTEVGSIARGGTKRRHHSTKSTAQAGGG